MAEIGVDFESRVDWDKLRRERIARTVAMMKREGLKAMLVQRLENLRYLTCMRPFVSHLYFPRYAAVIFDTGHVCLLTEAGDYALVKRGMPWIDDVRIWSYDLNATIADLLKLFNDNDFTEGSLGYDDVTSPQVLFALRDQVPGLDLVDATGMFGLGRVIKDSEEIKILREAAQIAEIGMAAARNAIGEGVKESEIAAEMAYAMISAGADLLASHPQVSTDAFRRTATDRRLRYGEVVLVDINIGYNGYVGDFARCFAVGTPSDEQRRSFAVQLECLDAAISAVKPGADPQDIQDAVEKIIKQAGLTKYWADYITGHGVGAGIGPIEQPLIGSTMGPVKRLEPGMVIAFEPGIFDPEIGPIRNEEMVLVTETGHEVLTKFGYCEKLAGK